MDGKDAQALDAAACSTAGGGAGAVMVTVDSVYDQSGGPNAGKQIA